MGKRNKFQRNRGGLGEDFEYAYSYDVDDSYDDDYSSSKKSKRKKKRGLSQKYDSYDDDDWYDDDHDADAAEKEGCSDTENGIFQRFRVRKSSSDDPTLETPSLNPRAFRPVGGLTDSNESETFFDSCSDKELFQELKTNLKTFRQEWKRVNYRLGWLGRRIPSDERRIELMDRIEELKRILDTLQDRLDDCE